MRIQPLCFIVLFVFAVALAHGDNKPSSVHLASTSPITVPAPSADSWQSIRGKQPSGLRLVLTTPKTHYYLGEIIPAKLTFSNESRSPYHLWTGTYDRSGRIPDIVFRAEAEDGKQVSDPLDWYFKHIMGICGGLGNFQNLGAWDISLPANQWLKFETPGKYRVYASSTRVQPGDTDAPQEQQLPRVELVSDPVTITIDPLGADQEKAVIRQAMLDLSGTYAVGRDGRACDAAQRLRFLQTPAACDALLSLIDSPYSGDAKLGLCACLDHSALADKILAAVRQGKLGLGGHLMWLYPNLRNNGNIFMTDDRPSSSELSDELYAAAKSAITENGTGDVFFADLLTLFCKNPHEPGMRKIMIKRQLDLPPKQVNGLVKENATKVDRDFLPLLRQQVKPDKHNPWALAALATLAPDEARPIVVEDIKRSKPIYIPTDHVFSPLQDLFALEALPDREMPALDPILRARLPMRKPPYDQDDIEATMLLIERYGTKALLPDVLRIYETNEGSWHCILQAAVLRYWIHCDPTAGVAALGRALDRDTAEDTGCFREVLTDVLHNNWVDQALPLVLTATRTQDLQVLRSAASLLEAHAGPEAIDRIIDAIERVSARPLPKNDFDRDQLLYVPRELTNLLLDSQRWKLTRPQLERLLKGAVEEDVRERVESKLAGIAN